MKRKLAYLFTMLSLSLMTACRSHVFMPATCTDPEICEECDKTQGEALGHEYGEATCEKPETCIRCGETRGEALGHVYDQATCEKPEICTRCGNTGRAALGHDWQEATCTVPKTCKTCGKTEGAPMGHTYSEGSCTVDSVCVKCGDKIPAPGHDFAPATCTTPSICRSCGTTDGEALGHDLKNLSCTRCDYTLLTLEEINRVCSQQATCETNKYACVVDTEKDHNPYDVKWDYGEEYNAYVDACDWSLVFDVEYYKKAFPMLAVQYHDDDALLLEHFQTVGIHEGRQGSEKFNVAAYYYNVDVSVYKAFDKNWAAYYFYYMYHYDDEKSVNTVTANNGKETKKQLKMIMTYIQKQEHKEVNAYRAEVGAQEVTFDSEIAAFANFRAYINAHDGYRAHDWAENDLDRARGYLDILGNWSSFAENTVTVFDSKTVKDWAAKYRTSQKHYDAMVNTKYYYSGYSNAYYGTKVTSQFDVYTSSLNTTMHPN